MDDALDILSDDLFDLPNNLVDNNLLEEIDSLDLFQDFPCDLVTDKKSYPTPQYTQIENKSNINFDNVYYEPSQTLPIKPNHSFALNNRCNYPVEQNIKLTNSSQINNLNVHKNYKSSGVQNNAPQNGRTKQQIRNIPKQSFQHIQPILPASSNDIIHNPTLAATLIDSKPCVNISPSHSSDCKYEDDDDILPVSGKRGVRKNSHNAIEKRYRLSINDKIDELRAMLFDNDDGKMNKSSVLKKAIDRIKGLEDNNIALKNENYRLKLALQQKSNDSQDSCQLLDHTSMKSSQYAFSSNTTNPINNSTSNIANGSSPLSSNPSDDFIDPTLPTSNSGESSNSSSNGSDFGNSPTSNNASSIPYMHSQLQQNQRNQVPIQKIINNSLSTRQLKRPLIYDNQQNNSRYNSTIKNEKLARLLLGNSNDTPIAARIEPRQSNTKFVTTTKIYQNGSSPASSFAANTNNQERSTTTHQQLPSFLLCTCALFIVAFEPISRIKDSYQLKKMMASSGSAGQMSNKRHILQYGNAAIDPTSSSSESLWSYLFLTLIQWILAFILIRISSRRNRNGNNGKTTGIYYYFYTLIGFIHIGIVSLFRYLIDPFKLGSQSTKSRIKLAVDEISDSYSTKNDSRLSYSRFMTILSKSNCIIPSRYGKIRLCLQMTLLSCSNSISWIFLHTKSTNQTIDYYLDVYTKLVEHINRNETKTELSFLQRAWSRVFLYYLIQLSAKCSCIEKRNMAWFVLLQTIKNNLIRKIFLRNWEITSLPNVKVKSSTLFYSEFIKYCKNKKLSNVSDQILDGNFNKLKLPIKIDQLDIYECYYFGFVMNIINESMKKLANGSQLDDSSQISILRHIISNSLDQCSNSHNNTLVYYDYLECWCNLLLVMDRINYVNNSGNNDNSDGDDGGNLDDEVIELIENLVMNLHKFYHTDGNDNDNVLRYLDFVKTCSKHQLQMARYDDIDYFTKQDYHYSLIIKTLSKLTQYHDVSMVHVGPVLINLGLTCTFKSLSTTIRSRRDYYRPKNSSILWKSGVYYSQQFLQLLISNEQFSNDNCRLLNSKIKQFSGLLELACDINPIRNNSTIKGPINHESISNQSNKDGTDKLSIINSYTNIISSMTKLSNSDSKLMTISNKDYLSNKITEESRLIQ